MKRSLYAFALLAGIALVPAAANATTVWDFSGTSLQANGYTPAPSGGTGSISAYAFQTDANGNLLSTPVTNKDSGVGGTSTLNGLFQVNDLIQDHGAGIAPYNPTEGGNAGTSGDGFPNQDGISDAVANVGTQFTHGPYSNFLELQLGATIPAGTTLTFLMQHADAGGGDSSVNVSYGDGTVGSGIAPSSLTHVLPGNPISVNGDDNTVGQFSITTDGHAEVVAIVADCHYLLLDKITGMSSVPEPRFYGILLAGLLGLVGMFVQNRKRVTE